MIFLLNKNRKTPLVRKAPLGTKWFNVVQCCSMWRHLAPIGAKWFHLAPHILWLNVAQCGDLWKKYLHNFEPLGAMWFDVVLKKKLSATLRHIPTHILISFLVECGASYSMWWLNKKNFLNHFEPLFATFNHK